MDDSINQQLVTAFREWASICEVSDFAARYELAETIRNITNGNCRGNIAGIKQAAAAVGISKPFIYGLLKLTAEIDYETYYDLFKAAEGNEVILYWSHMLAVVKHIPKEQSDTRAELFAVLTNEQMPLCHWLTVVRSASPKKPKTVRRSAYASLIQSKRFVQRCSELAKQASDMTAYKVSGTNPKMDRAVLANVERAVREIQKMYKTTLPRLTAFQDQLEAGVKAGQTDRAPKKKQKRQAVNA